MAWHHLSQYLVTEAPAAEESLYGRLAPRRFMRYSLLVVHFAHRTETTLYSAGAELTLNRATDMAHP